MNETKVIERGVRRSHRSRNIKVYLSDVEENDIKTRAERLHLPVAVYMRMAVLNYRRRD